MSMLIFIFLGIISSIFQLVIFREFTFSIAKNELSFIVAVGIWLVFCSLGSLLGKKIKRLSIGPIALGFCLVFSLSVFAIHLAKTIVGFSYYEAASLIFVIASSFILIGPLSLLVGLAFSVLSQNYLTKKYSSDILAKFFAYEALGFFIGGLLFSFIFSRYSNPFIFSFLPLIFLFSGFGNTKKKILSGLIIIFLSLISVGNFNQVVKKELKNSNILSNRGSSYGPIIEAEKIGIKSIYANGSLIATSEDKSSVEEFIHISLSAHKSPEKILFVGPALSGQINEILKHKVARVDCLEINPVLSAMSRERLGSLENVNFIIDDPRRFISRTNEKYNFILLNMPAPSNLSYNRYFSYEFFKNLQKVMLADTVLAFSIPSKRDVLSPKFVNFNSCIVNTVRKVFKNVLLVPSDSMIIIASNKKISSSDLLQNFSELSIDAAYFTKYHLIDYLDQERLQYVEDKIAESKAINYDFYPLGFVYFSLLEQAKFYPDLSSDTNKFKRTGLIIFILVLLVSVFLTKRRSFLFMVSSIGFSSIAVNSVIFLAFQIFSGGLFWKLGLLTGFFMLGLSLGAYLVNKMPKNILLQRKSLICFYCLWIFYLTCLGIMLHLASKLSFFGEILYLFSFISGILTGGVYPFAAKALFGKLKKSTRIPALVYSADLIGAFLGTFFFSYLFIPFFGTFSSLILVGIVLVCFCFVNLAKFPA